MQKATSRMLEVLANQRNYRHRAVHLMMTVTTVNLASTESVETLATVAKMQNVSFEITDRCVHAVKVLMETRTILVAQSVAALIQNVNPMKLASMATASAHVY